MAQINYLSRNQIHCTANLNFGLMFKKAKHCWALLTNFLILFRWVQVIVFLSCFASCWIGANYFKIDVLRSDSMKRNFRGFTFTKVLLISLQIFRPSSSPAVHKGGKEVGKKGLMNCPRRPAHISLLENLNFC